MHRAISTGAGAGAPTRTALQAFAAGVAHQLNNPLAAVLMAARHALRSPHDPVAAAGLLHEIIADAERCARVVRDMQRFANHAAGARRPLDLLELVRRAALGAAAVQVSPPAAAACVCGDAAQLEQAVRAVLAAVWGVAPQARLEVAVAADRVLIQAGPFAGAGRDTPPGLGLAGAILADHGGRLDWSADGAAIELPTLPRAAGGAT